MLNWFKEMAIVVSVSRTILEKTVKHMLTGKNRRLTVKAGELTEKKPEACLSRGNMLSIERCSAILNQKRQEL